MKRNIIETLMGAVVLLVAGFFVVFAYTSNGLEKTNGNTYHARFDRVDGIVIGSDVRMSGVKVGTITGIIIDPETYLAQVTLTVDKALPLPIDSSVEIISNGLLGDKYLAVVPGGETDSLKDGEDFKHTQSSVSLEAIIGQLIFSNKSDKKDAPTPSGS